MIPTAFTLLAVSAVALTGGCGRKEVDMFTVTAHRGASAAAPENTIAAIERAIGFGAHFAEVDVHMSRDGRVVLMHDESVNRTTDGQGNVWDLTLEELKGLDAGSWFAEEFRGEPVPTLREAIDLARGKIKLNIEIKVSRDEPDIAEKVVGIIREEAFEDDCMVTSFDRETVEEVKRLAPDITTGHIFGKGYEETVFGGGWEVLSCSKDIVDEDFVARAGDAGKSVHVWTVNDEPTMIRLIGIGVDGIITNKPDLLFQVLSASMRRGSER